jgi:tetratricopeptide (TPR) repeat protein
VFLLQLLAWVALAWPARTQRLKTAAKVVLPIVGLTAVFLLLVFDARSQLFSPPNLFDRFTFQDETKMISMNERVDFWQDAFVLAGNRPLAGWGPGSFQFVGQRLQNNAFEIADDPHDYLLKLAAERGWFAALSFLLLVGSIVTSAIKGKRDAMKTASLIGCLGIFAHSLIDRDMHFLAIALPFWLLLGLLANATAAHGRSERRMVRLLEILLCAALFLLLFVPEVGDAPLARARMLMDTSKADQAQEVLEQYQQLNAQDARVWTLLGESMLMNGNTMGALYAYDRAFQIGRLNYPAIMEGFVRVALSKHDPTIVSARYSGIDYTIRAFTRAITNNDHDIALSRTPEELTQLIDDLSLLSLSSVEDLVPLRARILQQAEHYRTEHAIEPNGYLW